MHPPQIFIYALRAHFLRSRAFIRWFRLSDSLANYSPVAEINAVFHDWTWADFLLLYSFLNEGKGGGKIYNFFREEYSKERKRCCCEEEEVGKKFVSKLGRRQSEWNSRAFLQLFTRHSGRIYAAVRTRSRRVLEVLYYVTSDSNAGDTSSYQIYRGVHRLTSFERVKMLRQCLPISHRS